MTRELLLIDDVERKIKLLVNNVEKSFVMISEEFGGWHHYLFTKRVSCLGTALGVACLSYLIKSINQKVALSLNFLDKSINKDGGFGIKIIEDGRKSLTESTSYICLSLILLLNRVELREYEQKVINLIKTCINWLIENQNPSEGWGPRKGYESRVFSTSIALIALQNSLKNNLLSKAFEQQFKEKILRAVNDGIKWLIRVRNRDGGWGELPSKRSTPFHTSIAIMALNLSEKFDDRLIRKAKKWLLDNWDKKQMWEITENPTNITETYDILKDHDRWSRATWNHFPTPWVITALTASGEDFNRFEIFEGLKWLLKQAKKGYIIRSTDSYLPIWAIWDVLPVFERFKTQYQNRFRYYNKARQWILKLSKLSLKIITKLYAYIILFLYITIGYFFVYMNKISIENYIFGLLIPITLLIIDKIIGAKKS